MSIEETQIQDTQHAFLVVWGWFGEQIGLIKGIDEVELAQKNYIHSPQARVKEFFVGILAGGSNICRTSATPSIRWTWIRRWRRRGEKKVGQIVQG